MRLTKREYEVAELISQGLSDEEIAKKLVVSSKTIKSHKMQIYSKLGFTGIKNSSIRVKVTLWVLNQKKE